MRVSAAIGAAGLIAGAALAADKPTQFWNLTSKTVIGLRLSHGGSGEFGGNVVAGDADGVDHDERAQIPGLTSGLYDLELKLTDGRTCIIRAISIQAGKVFSVEDKALTACSKT